MKLKLTLRRSGRPDVDLVATLDSAATVGDLATFLATAAPVGAAPVSAPAEAAATIRLLGAQAVTLDARLPVAESGLRSGSVVSLGSAGERFSDARAGGAAVLTVTAGPDRGREYALERGTSVIGRERGCEVRLTDPLVSRRHARLSVADVVEIVDLGSANGVSVGDTTVARTLLRAGDTVRVGDTELSVRVLHSAPQDGMRDAGAVAFVRSPVLTPHYDGVAFDAPEPPERPPVQRFPMIALVAPILMGGLLYLITKSTASLAFVALSPVMAIGSALESRFAGRSSFAKSVARFRADVEELVATATAEHAREVVERVREFPSPQDCAVGVQRGLPLLWSRRPDDPSFLQLRLGLGTQPSRSTIDLPDGKRGPRALHAELREAIAPLRTVDGVPVLASPADDGAVGVAGPRQAMLGVARGLILQWAALCSPAELTIAAFASSSTAPDWDWLKWLPHTTSPNAPVEGRCLESTGPGTMRLASALEDLVEQRAADRGPAPFPAVAVVVEDDAPIDRSRLVGLAEHGWRHGVFVLWLAGDRTRLPAACRTFVDLITGGSGATVGYVHSGGQVDGVDVEPVTAVDAMNLARSLAPIVDAGARVEDDSDLPRSVSLLALAGSQLSPDASSVLERWTANRSILSGPFAPAVPVKRAGTLRAVIGESTAQPHAIDLRADGPHALVGGTTGSGKSELLQTWILAMAAAHSPQRLTFLLVDYKGGSAFSECVRLPHTVGLVTDLSPHLVRRALTSLSAELRYREHVLGTHKAKDLVELEKRGITDAPPSLVIVVDEFAALVNEVPEFVDGVVNVAQRGRSLGLHLILATQRPAGVIKDNLRANTNLRLALRVADEADSIDVLGSAQAAFFDPAIPGRAVSKTGPGRLVPFQTSYAGGRTSAEPPPPEILVEELEFGAGQSWEIPAVDEVVVEDAGPTDIVRLVDAVRAASRMAELGEARKPWLPELAAVYNLADRDAVTLRRRDDEIVFGVRDDPHNQRQPMVLFEPDRDGNLAVFGTGGTGKSTLLRTIAISAGFTARGGLCHVYGLDFGARGLAMLEDLPHVGSIIAGGDHERITRVLTKLRSLIDERATRYSRADAGTITEYRRATGATGEARILLILDGVAAFRSAYEVGDRSRWFDMLVGIASDGRPVGVHLLVSADRPAAIPSMLASSVQRRVVLRMADPNDYALLGMPIDVLDASSPPGRGLVGDDEVQVALLCDVRQDRDPETGVRSTVFLSDVASQASAVRKFSERSRELGVTEAPPIPRLAERVDLTSLPVADPAGNPVVGLSAETLGPIGIVPRGSFLISGPPGSGRSSALAMVAEALHRHRPGVTLYVIGSRRSPLHELSFWRERIIGPTAVTERVPSVASDIAMASGNGGGPIAVFVENVADFVNGPAENALQELAKVVLGEDQLLVCEGETSTLSASFGLMAHVKSSRAGIALQPDSGDGTAVYRTNFPPRLNRADFPVGRGLLVAQGKTTVVQLALGHNAGRG